MTLSPTTETPRRRLFVVGAITLASISLALLAGYVLRAAPQRILASQGAPEPVTLGGRVVDPDGKPLRGASVMVGSLLVQTDAEGRYTIGPLGIDRSALVRMPGYAKERLALEGKEQEVRLRPHASKAAYPTYYEIADKGNATLSTVAAPIGNALFATAAGLFAAIPAVVAYNSFVSRIKVFDTEMANFSPDFLNIVKRHFFR